MLCGFDLDRTETETERLAERVDFGEHININGLVLSRVYERERQSVCLRWSARRSAKATIVRVGLAKPARQSVDAPVT